MRPAIVLGLLVFGGCTVDVSLEGKACASTEPRCVEGYVCVDEVCVRPGASDAGRLDAGVGDAGSTDAGAGDAGATDAGTSCRLFDDDPPLRCTARTELYLAPDGDDARSGTSPAEAWATIGTHPIPAGARVHLEPGDYDAAGLLDGLDRAAAATCPTEILGPTDGGHARLLQATRFSGPLANVWLHDFEYAPTGSASAVQAGYVEGLRLERLTFTAAYTGGFPRDVELGSSTATILGCTFRSTGGEIISASYGALSLLGNRIEAHGGRVSLPEGALVRGNDVSGDFYGPSILFAGTGDAGLVVQRNVFHDLSVISGPLVAVSGADLVEGNTFVSFSGTAADRGVFRDNLVSGVTRGTSLSAEAADAGFNLFDAVSFPYASGAGVGDVSGVAVFDADFLPAAGSPAIDAADPLRPVPPGGGPRADIGALERGASLDAVRRYCLDGGV